MNRSLEQTNCLKTALRFTGFICPALRFIPHEPRKKDTHSLNECITYPLESLWAPGGRKESVIHIPILVVIYDLFGV